MTLTLLIAACLLLVTLNTCAFVATAMQLPGNWAMLFMTACLAWGYWDHEPARLIGGWTLAALLGLAIAGEIAETALAGVASRKAGGTRRGAVLAIVGAIPGAIVGSLLIPVPIIGTLIGAATGAGLGSFAGDAWARQPIRHAVRAARGAAVGKLTGTAAKLTVGAAMWLLVVAALIV